MADNRYDYSKPGKPIPKNVNKLDENLKKRSPEANSSFALPIDWYNQPGWKLPQNVQEERQDSQKEQQTNEMPQRGQKISQYTYSTTTRNPNRGQNDSTSNEDNYHEGISILDISTEEPQYPLNKSAKSGANRFAPSGSHNHEQNKTGEDHSLAGTSSMTCYRSGFNDEAVAPYPINLEEQQKHVNEDEMKYFKVIHGKMCRFIKTKLANKTPCNLPFDTKLFEQEKRYNFTKENWPKRCDDCRRYFYQFQDCLNIHKEKCKPFLFHGFSCPLCCNTYWSEFLLFHHLFNVSGRTGHHLLFNEAVDLSTHSLNRGLSMDEEEEFEMEVKNVNHDEKGVKVDNSLFCLICTGREQFSSIIQKRIHMLRIHFYYFPDSRFDNTKFKEENLSSLTITDNHKKRIIRGLATIKSNDWSHIVIILDKSEEPSLTRMSAKGGPIDFANFNPQTFLTLENYIREYFKKQNKEDIFPFLEENPQESLMEVLNACMRSRSMRDVVTFKELRKTDEQIATLKREYLTNTYIKPDKAQKLALEFGLTKQQVLDWFARERQKAKKTS